MRAFPVTLQWFKKISVSVFFSISLTRSPSHILNFIVCGAEALLTQFALQFREVWDFAWCNWEENCHLHGKCSELKQLLIFKRKKETDRYILKTLLRLLNNLPGFQKMPSAWQLVRSGIYQSDGKWWRTWEFWNTTGDFFWLRSLLMSSSYICHQLKILDTKLRDRIFLLQTLRHFMAFWLKAILNWFCCQIAALPRGQQQGHFQGQQGGWEGEKASCTVHRDGLKKGEWLLLPQEILVDMKAGKLESIFQQ